MGEVTEQNVHGNDNSIDKNHSDRAILWAVASYKVEVSCCSLESAKKLLFLLVKKFVLFLYFLWLFVVYCSNFYLLSHLSWSDPSKIYQFDQSSSGIGC